MNYTQAVRWMYGYLIERVAEGRDSTGAQLLGIYVEKQLPELEKEYPLHLDEFRRDDAYNAFRILTLLCMDPVCLERQVGDEAVLRQIVDAVIEFAQTHHRHTRDLDQAHFPFILFLFFTQIYFGLRTDTFARESPEVAFMHIMRASGLGAGSDH